MKEVRGQASVEYLLVLSLAFFLLIPGGYLFYSFSQGNADQLTGSRITRAGMEVVNAVEQRYAIGQNSWTTVEMNFPESVNNMYVQDKELVIVYETSNGMSEAVFFSKVNITTPYGGNVSQDFKPGFTKLKVRSRGANVEISEILT